ncbi:hypothetical protein KDH_79720 [Dictyobacter sp. S3.2.2.5]|uniref:Uncharacterized protein n=1 Tax=Dictyobacter halimunensis TaxID=3026934 RepID=A0ABQ6G8K8_9CHLR|nr:hypothetical protein KDH_79720 [Dictyobacter sp. S3.2.2.5]
MAKTKNNDVSVVGLITLLLFVAHLVIIAGDVQTIIDDPSKENKPAEVLKLAFDFTRYFG